MEKAEVWIKEALRANPEEEQPFFESYRLDVIPASMSWSGWPRPSTSSTPTSFQMTSLPSLAQPRANAFWPHPWSWVLHVFFSQDFAFGPPVGPRWNDQLNFETGRKVAMKCELPDRQYGFGNLLVSYCKTCEQNSPWPCNAESCKIKLVVLLFHALCSLLIYRSCCYDVQFFAFITDDKSAGCDLWNAWWDPSERKVGETATSLQPEGNAEAQPSNSSIWSLRSQHDWSKENRKYIMWYHVILISNDWCQRNYGCLDLDHPFIYFLHCILTRKGDAREVGHAEKKGPFQRKLRHSMSFRCRNTASHLQSEANRATPNCFWPHPGPMEWFSLSATASWWIHDSSEILISCYIYHYLCISLRKQHEEQPHLR